MYDTIVAGQTDFLYGFGTMFIEHSTLLLRSCGGGITAWKGTNTTFENKYGVYIAETKVIAANTTILEEKRGTCSLGRPWNNLHRSLIRNTYFDEMVLPAGYTWWAGSPNNNFGPNTAMAVFRNYGPGNDIAAQAESNITQVWSGKEARPYMTPEDVFMTPDGEQPNVGWLDKNVARSHY